MAVVASAGGLCGAAADAVLTSAGRHEAAVGHRGRGALDGHLRRPSGRLVAPVLAAACAALVGWRVGTGREVWALLYLAALVPALAVVDIRTRRLPNVLVLPSFPVVAVLLAVGVATPGGAARLRDALVSFLVVAAVVVAVALARVPLGMGDLKLMLLIGLAVGSLGPAAVVVALAVTCVAAAVVGVAGLAAGRGMPTRLPYGPFLGVGALVAVVAGHDVVRLYLGLLSGA